MPLSEGVSLTSSSLPLLPYSLAIPVTLRLPQALVRLSRPLGTCPSRKSHKTVPPHTAIPKLESSGQDHPHHPPRDLPASQLRADGGHSLKVASAEASMWGGAVCKSVARSSRHPGMGAAKSSVHCTGLRCVWRRECTHRSSFQTSAGRPEGRQMSWACSQGSSYKMPSDTQCSQPAPQNSVQLTKSAVPLDSRPVIPTCHFLMPGTLLKSNHLLMSFPCEDSFLTSSLIRLLLLTRVLHHRTFPHSCYLHPQVFRKLL